MTRADEIRAENEMYGPVAGETKVNLAWPPLGPDMALNAAQKIRLACLRMMVESRATQSITIVEPISNRQFKREVDGLAAYVTTGNWPDTNGPTE